MFLAGAPIFVIEGPLEGQKKKKKICAAMEVETFERWKNCGRR